MIVSKLNEFWLTSPGPAYASAAPSAAAFDAIAAALAAAAAIAFRVPLAPFAFQQSASDSEGQVGQCQQRIH